MKFICIIIEKENDSGHNIDHCKLKDWYGRSDVQFNCVIFWMKEKMCLVNHGCDVVANTKITNTKYI